MSYFVLQYQDDSTGVFPLRMDDVGVTAYKELHAGAGEILRLFWLLSLVSLVLLSDVKSPTTTPQNPQKKSIPITIWSM